MLAIQLWLEGDGLVLSGGGFRPPFSVSRGAIFDHNRRCDCHRVSGDTSSLAQRLSDRRNSAEEDVRHVCDDARRTRDELRDRLHHCFHTIMIRVFMPYTIAPKVVSFVYCYCNCGIWQPSEH